MAYLDLSALQKSFGANQVVKSFDLGVAKGEFVSLLGPGPLRSLAPNEVLLSLVGWSWPAPSGAHWKSLDKTIESSATDPAEARSSIRGRSTENQ